MNTPSTAVTAAFVVLVLALGTLFVHAVAVGTAPAGERSRATWRWRTTAIGLALLWLIPPAVLVRLGVLERFDAQPPPLLIMMALLTLGTVMVAFSPLGLRLARGGTLAWLVGFQAFRIPVELILHRLYVEGVIPVQMSYAGLNFDVVSGITAALLAVWLVVGRPPHRVIGAWNVLGLVLLAVIVGIAVLSTPLPVRRFMDPPANLLPVRFPWVWLPSFLVQGALLGHLLVLRRLRQRRSR